MIFFCSHPYMKMFLFFSAFRSLYFRELTIFIKLGPKKKKVSLFIIPKGIKIVNWLYLNILLFLPLSRYLLLLDFGVFFYSFLIHKYVPESFVAGRYLA